MEKFKTLNNSYAKDYIKCIADGNLRACAYLLFNSRDMYEPTVYKRLCRYFFDKFPFTNELVCRECLEIFNCDYVVINYIVKLYYEEKGGVFDDKRKENMVNLRKNN